MEIHTQGRVHQDGVVELGGGLGDVDRLHLLEAAQRVTLWHQLRDCPLVEGARDQQDDVINHIAVPEVTGRWGEVVMTRQRSLFYVYAYLPVRRVSLRTQRVKGCCVYISLSHIS